MMKDIEWLKNEIIEYKKLILEFADKNEKDAMIRVIDKVARSIGELEIETLTPDWVDKNSTFRQFVTGEGLDIDKFVKANKLKNILVPKQEKITEEQAWEKIRESYTHESMMEAHKYLLELNGYTVIEKPVVPQYIEDWIEKTKDGTLWDAFNWITDIDEHREIFDFLLGENENRKENHDLAVRAWLTYRDEEVKKEDEEEKFYVYLGDGQYLVSVDELKEPHARIRHQEDSGFANYVLTFTEKEIKDYDERYWAFKERVK